MTSRRRKRRWWGVTAAYALLVLVLSVIPTAPGISPAALDKLAHLCLYLLFAWLLVQAFRVSGVEERLVLVWAGLFAASYGMVMELLQLCVPWRTAEPLDMAFNAVGALVGVWVGRRFPHAHPLESARR